MNKALGSPYDNGWDDGYHKRPIKPHQYEEGSEAFAEYLKGYDDGRIDAS